MVPLHSDGTQVFGYVKTGKHHCPSDCSPRDLGQGAIGHLQKTGKIFPPILYLMRGKSAMTENSFLTM